MLLLLPTAVFGQQSLFSAAPGEGLNSRIIPIADFSGDGQNELQLQIWNRETGKQRLLFLDAQTYLERAVYHITLKYDYEVTSGDIDGDGITETILIPMADTFRPRRGQPGLVIVRRVGESFLRTEFSEFWGVWGNVGDMNGNGRDELVLFRYPRGMTNLGGTGPIDIQVFEWNGSGFDLSSVVSLPVMYLKTEIKDLDGDQRAELIVLKSGGRDNALLANIERDNSEFNVVYWAERRARDEVKNRCWRQREQGVSGCGGPARDLHNHEAGSGRLSSLKSVSSSQDPWRLTRRMSAVRKSTNTRLRS